MKRIISYCLIITMLILASCGKPSDMSDSTYSALKKIIQYTDAYINMDMNYNEYTDKCDEARKQINSSESTTSLIADSNVVRLKLSILNHHFSLSTNSLDDVINTRNELADSIGEPKYKH